MGMQSRMTWRLRVLVLSHQWDLANFGKKASVFHVKFSVPIGQRRQASAWKNRVLPVADNDKNDVYCSDRDTASRLECVWYSFVHVVRSED